jgi:hypothetical protein
MENLVLFQAQHMIRPSSLFIDDYDIIEKKDGINSFFVRYIYKVTKSGVEVVRTRTNHKVNLKKGIAYSYTISLYSICSYAFKRGMYKSWK